MIYVRAPDKRLMHFSMFLGPDRRLGGDYNIAPPREGPKRARRRPRKAGAWADPQRCGRVFIVRVQQRAWLVPNSLPCTPRPTCPQRAATSLSPTLSPPSLTTPVLSTPTPPHKFLPCLSPAKKATRSARPSLRSRSSSAREVRYLAQNAAASSSSATRPSRVHPANDEDVPPYVPTAVSPLARARGPSLSLSFSASRVAARPMDASCTGSSSRTRTACIARLQR